MYYYCIVVVFPPIFAWNWSVLIRKKFLKIIDIHRFFSSYFVFRTVCVSTRVEYFEVKNVNDLFSLRIDVVLSNDVFSTFRADWKKQNKIGSSDDEFGIGTFSYCRTTEVTNIQTKSLRAYSSPPSSYFALLVVISYKDFLIITGRINLIKTKFYSAIRPSLFRGIGSRDIEIQL